jgi:hypothetical protein
VIKDSSKRRKFKTGSQRDGQNGKGRFDLLPMWALSQVAIHFEEGAEKYDARNWELGQPISTYIDCAMRHLVKWAAGYKDERHDRACAWNVLCAMETKHRVDIGILPKELDDMPPCTWDGSEAEEYIEWINKQKGNKEE